MNKKILNLCKAIEDKFNCICYAYEDSFYWAICIDNYNLYFSTEFFKFTKYLRAKYKKLRLVFFYCNPSEKSLLKLASENNLVMSIV
jgi:hypothetical protein